MSHQVVCRIRVDERGRALQFTWSVGSSAFPTYALRDVHVEQFRRNAQVARDRLFDLVTLHRPAAADRDRPRVRRCCLDLARAGHDLYNQIFAREAEPRGAARTVRDWLREISLNGEVQSLEVVSEGQPWFAPWNTVYDDDPVAERFLQGGHPEDGGAGLPDEALRPFWGIRYNLCGGIPVEPLRRKRLPDPPEVLLVIDQVVCDNLAAHVDATGVSQQHRLRAFIATCREANAGVVFSREELRQALKRRWHLIYWLGHADPTYLALSDDKVKLDDLANFLRDTDDDRVPPGGVVFLNACRTGDSGGRGLGSFLEVFHDADYSGIIATEEQTLDNLACPFGLEAMTAFLKDRRPIGEVLQELRDRYAPVGLLYGAYCPPDVQVRAEAPPTQRGPAGRTGFGGTAEGRELGPDRAAAPERGRGGSRQHTGPSRPCRRDPTCRWRRTAPSIAPCSPGATTTSRGWPGFWGVPRPASWCCTARAASASRRSSTPA
jgi:hypothetical protein